MQARQSHDGRVYCNARFPTFAKQTRTLLSRQPDQNKHALSSLIAAAVHHEYGEAEMFCYGLGEAGMDLKDRQRRLIDTVATRLESELTGRARVLFSGPSLHGMAAQFAEDGNHCLWLSPLAAGDSRLQGPFRVATGDFAQLSSHESFDAIVLEGTIHYLDQLAYLQKARHLLREGGILLVVGEYLDDDSRIESSDLASLTSCRQLSARLGFALLSEEDLSAGAVDSIHQLQALVDRHHGELERELDGNGSIDSALVELAGMATEFANGRRCVHLFAWRRQALAEGEYTEAEYGAIDSFDPAEVAMLFNASFGKPFDAAVWHWKYALNNGRCIVARSHHNGSVVSHYGGAPRRIDYFGTAATAIQVCDVMVQPEHRRLYGKSSLFFKTAATFLEREIGNTVGHLLGFGFPNQKAMNIATRLGLYAKTDDFVELGYSNPEKQEGAGRALPFDPASEQQAQSLERLWQAMRRDFSGGIIGVRDTAYVNYRYRRHPHAGQYQCLLLEDSGEELAVAVLKRQEEHLLLMDLIGPLAHMAPALSLLRQTVAGYGGIAGLKFWVTRGWLKRLPTAAAIVNDLGIEIPCNSWNPGPDADTLYGAWWLTAGDMDFM